MIHVDLIWFYFFFSKREHSLRKWWNRWLSHYEVGLADRVGRNCSSRLIVYLVLPSFFFFFNWAVAKRRWERRHPIRSQKVSSHVIQSFNDFPHTHADRRRRSGDGHHREKGAWPSRGRRWAWPSAIERSAVITGAVAVDRQGSSLFLSFFLPFCCYPSVCLFLSSFLVCLFFFLIRSTPVFLGDPIDVGPLGSSWVPLSAFVDGTFIDCHAQLTAPSFFFLLLLLLLFNSVGFSFLHPRVTPHGRSLATGIFFHFIRQLRVDLFSRVRSFFLIFLKFFIFGFVFIATTNDARISVASRSQKRTSGFSIGFSWNDDLTLVEYNSVV